MKVDGEAGETGSSEEFINSLSAERTIVLDDFLHLQTRPLDNLTTNYVLVSFIRDNNVEHAQKWGNLLISILLSRFAVSRFFCSNFWLHERSRYVCDDHDVAIQRRCEC